MFVAHWNGIEIARSEHCISVENNLYFPPESVNKDLLVFNPGTSSFCEWKGGAASYFDIVTPTAENYASAWKYNKLGEYAHSIEGWYSFWKGVQVKWTGDGAGEPEVLEAIKPNVAKALNAKNVIWRPLLDFLDPDNPFSGYLIPDLNVIVDVLSRPPEDQISRAVEDARTKAKKITQFSKQAGNQKYSYIAVWGSSPPVAEAVTALKAHRSVLQLKNDIEIVE